MKVLSLFSGGLDSILASLLIKNLGIDVQAVFFETPFFSSRRAAISANQTGLPIEIIDITHRHIAIVKDPPHGYGGNMNPCIDCHALMFRAAGEMMEKMGASFLISGEVLGQRPMSQNRQSLDLVERISGYQGMILRPLSAKLLSLTIPEQKGWVNREMLLNLSGRSRKPQIAMAKELGIPDYPVPAGGCLLTDSIFSQRLKDLFLYNPDASVNDLELLKLGRHFRLNPFTKIIIGRNMEENTRILGLVKETDVVIHTLSVPGPVALISGEHSDEIIKRGAEMNASYCNEKLEEIDMVIVEKDISGTIQVYGKEKSEFRHLMI